MTKRGTPPPKKKIDSKGNTAFRWRKVLDVQVVVNINPTAPHGCIRFHSTLFFTSYSPSMFPNSPTANVLVPALSSPNTLKSRYLVRIIRGTISAHRRVRGIYYIPHITYDRTRPRLIRVCTEELHTVIQAIRCHMPISFKHV